MQDRENGDFRFAKPVARSGMGVVGNAACPNVRLAPQYASHVGTNSEEVGKQKQKKADTAKFGGSWAKWGAKNGVANGLHVRKVHK